MQRCQRGHYFDPEKYPACPACGVDGLEIVSTKAKHSATPPATPMPSTQSRGQGHANQAEDMKSCVAEGHLADAVENCTQRVGDATGE